MARWLARAPPHRAVSSIPSRRLRSGALSELRARRALPTMDKRFFLALVLTAIVIVATPLLFPGAKPPGRDTGRRRLDASCRRRQDSVASHARPRRPPIAGARLRQSPLRHQSPAAPLPAPVETTTVRTTRARRTRSRSRGAAPVSVVLDSYPSRRPVAARPARWSCVRARTPLAPLSPGARRGHDRAGHAWRCAASSGPTAGRPRCTMPRTIAGRGVQHRRTTFVPDSFLVRVSAPWPARRRGARSSSTCRGRSPRNEADTSDDMGHLARQLPRTRSEVEERRVPQARHRGSADRDGAARLGGDAQQVLPRRVSRRGQAALRGAADARRAARRRRSASDATRRWPAARLRTAAPRSISMPDRRISSGCAAGRRPRPGEPVRRLAAGRRAAVRDHRDEARCSG